MTDNCYSGILSLTTAIYYFNV